MSAGRLHGDARHVKMRRVSDSHPLTGMREHLMAFQRWVGSLLVSGLVSLVAVGCSSSSGGSNASDTDAGTIIHRMLDAGGSVVDDAGSTTIATDGTTGKACKSDSDCTSDGGPGTNICSVGVSAMITNVTVTPWPTPVCLLDIGQGTGNCDPGTAATGPVFCDGDPTDPASPGLCVPLDNPPQSGRGLCYPKCTFAFDGSTPVGCIGFDTCTPLEVVQDTTTNAITGYGFCFGTCTKDTDCSALGATVTCQTDIGFCTTKKLARTKQPGDPCSLATTSTDSTTGACYCDGDTTTGLGFCSTACVTGGDPCANGWLCDADQATSLDFGTGTLTPVTMQNKGFPGICRPACSLSDSGAPAVVDAGVVADGGGDGAVSEGGAAGDANALSPGACPANSTCQSTNVVGTDCIP
jgi:hypothetical protein